MTNFEILNLELDGHKINVSLPIAELFNSIGSWDIVQNVVSDEGYERKVIKRSNGKLRTQLTYIDKN